MDRLQSFIGQELYEWSLSAPDRNTMVALAKMCSAVFGGNGMANGLACTQTTVASMQVSIGQGELYQVASLEASTSGTLPADTTNTIVKQGILLGSAAPVNLPASSTFAAPGTAGQSINYLIEAQYQDQDVSLDPTTGASPVTLNFFNSSNPATPWSGPGNAGTSSNTFRKGIIAWQVKAGTAAATGTQTTPSPDSGWIGLWVVTVANGQVTITSTSIAAYQSAPFLPSTGLVVGGLQGSACITSAAGGTADALTGAFQPAITALVNGMTLLVRAASANATTTPTFTPASGVVTAKTIVKGNGLALAAGDIAGAGHWIELQYDLTLDKWVLLNPATGVISTGRLLNVQTVTATGTYTPTAGTTSVIVEVLGGGGAGGGATATGAGQISGGTGGNAGAYGKSRITSGFAGATVTIGAAGVAVSGAAGGAGGTSSFGAFVTAPGGSGGLTLAAFTPPLISGQPVITAATGGTIINAAGGLGGQAISVSTGASISGAGGNSVFGGGANSVGSGNGAASSTKGAGGSGALNPASTAASIGGNGAAGLVVIHEYA